MQLVYFQQLVVLNSRTVFSTSKKHKTKKITRAEKRRYKEVAVGFHSAKVHYDLKTMLGFKKMFDYSNIINFTKNFFIKSELYIRERSSLVNGPKF